MKNVLFISLFFLLISTKSFCTNIFNLSMPDSLMNVSVYKAVKLDSVKLPIKMLNHKIDLINEYRLPTDGKDISSDLQHAIDKLSQQGGGEILITKGKYKLSEINLKSNIHILIEKDVIIYPFLKSKKGSTVFIVGSEKNDNSIVENVSIQGIGGRFKVILSSEYKPYITKFVFIRSSNVKKFYYANFDIFDNITTMPSLGFSAAKPNDKNFIGSTDGVVANITAINAHYGYGTIQVQAGKNIRFYNLHGIGGITLRLETGSTIMNKLQFGGVFNIIGKNISVVNGHSAVMCGPHGMKNGICHFYDITAKSSGSAFIIGEGWSGKDGKGSNGYFQDGTSVENVTAIFGNNAQIKTKELQKIPIEYLDKLNKPGKEGIIIGAPSHTCVSIQTSRHIIYDRSTFHAIGFKNNDAIRISKCKIDNKEKQKKMMSYIKKKYKL